MHHSCSCSWQRVAFAWAIVVPIAVSAQSKANDPSDPAATVSVTPYQSVFSDYQAYQDVPLVPWRQSNDAMRPMAESSGAHKMESMGTGMPSMKNSGSTGSAPAHDMSNMGMPQKAKD
jgi:hypothetical protein